MSLCVVKEWKRIRTGMSDGLASALDWVTRRRRGDALFHYYTETRNFRDLLLFRPSPLALVINVFTAALWIRAQISACTRIIKANWGLAACECDKLWKTLPSLHSPSRRRHFSPFECRGGMDAVANRNNKEREEAGEQKYRANNVHEISFIHYCTLNSISFRPLRRDLSFFNWNAF